MKNSLPVKFAQRKFLKIKTNQRNKNIYNIDQIDHHQKMQRRKRRTPFTRAANPDINQKFHESFMNSTTVNSFKLQYDISKHRQKTGNSYFSSKNHTKCIYFLNDQPTTQLSPKKQGQMKGIPMNKMITRQYRESLDHRQNLNEQRFNNFYLTSTEEQKVRGFQKYVPRQSLKRLMTAPSDSAADIPRIYQKISYPSNAFSVNWDYKKQKWNRGPIYSRQNKQSSLLLQEIDPSKIEKGREATSSNWNRTINNFKSLSSKENPAQFERDFYPPNMYFRERKQQVKSDRKSIKIKQRAMRPDFERWQICNWKYFQLNPELRQRKIRVYTQ